VVIEVPPLIERRTFSAVQARLKQRRPMVTPPRITTGSVLLTGICFCAKCGGAMTLRTGKGGQYRYYTCSTRARQAKSGCPGQSIPMNLLGDLVANHLEKRLLKPERLSAILEAVLDRRQERTERRREHLAEPKRRITETEQRLNRLYDPIEAGVTDVNDPALKERVAGLKAIRDQAAIDAVRVEASLDSSGSQTITPDMVTTFARTARERIRIPGGAIAETTCAPWRSASKWPRRR
jgi:hypothetical protein